MRDKKMLKAVSVVALAMTAVGAAGSAHADGTNGWARGDVHQGIYCHGTDPSCTPAEGAVVKEGNRAITATVDVSHQTHDRNFTASVIYYDYSDKQISYNVKISANQGPTSFVVVGVPKGRYPEIMVTPWSRAPLDANSSIYLKMVEH